MKNILKKELLSLFLLVSFPINTWSIYVFLYNFEWVAERTNMSDALGYGAYALAFTLFESLLITLIITPLYLLLRKNHDIETSKAMIGITFIILSLWIIILRINISQDTSLFGFLFKIKSTYNIRFGYFLAIFFLSIGAVVASMLAPPFLVRKYKKIQSFTIELFHRIELLSYVYLVLNLVSIVVVIIRNIKYI
ncbi:MAG: hypothetical protein PVF83_06695 [Anaerolineales bacterium]